MSLVRLRKIKNPDSRGFRLIWLVVGLLLAVLAATPVLWFLGSWALAGTVLALVMSVWRDLGQVLAAPRGGAGAGID
ncbi:hypothetical protein DFR67_11611 [Williamsia limnetica]|uniref:Uncharacterized protein n=1 Tax=Williamsia limnetica TaxID=882452 RepID=A0A318RIM4_WILLI|nr:hypothetical protein DFR67_11611 [Williamsia limnetica]